MNMLRFVLLSTALFFTFGCSHSLEIKNLHQYQASSLITMPKQLSIGVSTSNTQDNGKTLVTGVANGLAKYAGNIVYPYYPANSRQVDIIANVTIRSDHRGSGWNFLIEWPGFLIWTPAWNGYVYRPSYRVDIELIRAADNMRMDSFSMPIDLNVRHAEIDRTWTEISWLEVSAIAFISGFVFIQYDDDVTPLLEREIKEPVGDYIAQEIANRIMNSRYFEAIHGGGVLQEGVAVSGISL